MTAHVAIIFTRYMMLVVANRQAIDERTLGKIFYCWGQGDRLWGQGDRLYCPEVDILA